MLGFGFSVLLYSHIYTVDSKYIVETVFLRTSLGIRKDRSEFTFRNSSGEYILGVSAVDGVIHISDEQNRKADSAHTH